MLINITACCFLLMSSLFIGNTESSDAVERVVVRSITSERNANIYLLADKLSWMDYRNFTVQIGDKGILTYNFPNWYSGKYYVEFLKEDINDDMQEDIIVVLNNDVAGPGKPVDEIHILNGMVDPYLRFQEAAIEPLESTVNRFIKMKQRGNTITVLADKKKYNVDISKYNYANPQDPYVSTEIVKYSIKRGKLIATIGAYVSYDAVTGGKFGNFDIEYLWDGKMYKAKSILFKNYIPKDN